MKIPGVHLRSRLARLAVLVVSLSVMSGCHDVGSGALWGAGIGALAGQAIGGNTESTIAGATIGAIIGANTTAASHGYASDGYYRYQTYPSHHHHQARHHAHVRHRNAGYRYDY